MGAKVIAETTHTAADTPACTYFRRELVPDRARALVTDTPLETTQIESTDVMAPGTLTGRTSWRHGETETDNKKSDCCTRSRATKENGHDSSPHCGGL